MKQGSWKCAQMSQCTYFYLLIFMSTIAATKKERNETHNEKNQTKYYSVLLLSPKNEWQRDKNKLTIIEQRLRFMKVH